MPHTHDHLCLTVEMFIVHRGRVLLRLHDKYGLWLSVGGHIEPGEDPTEAALREVREEVGLEVVLRDSHDASFPPEDGFRLLVAPTYVHRNNVSVGHEHVTFVYFASCTTDVIRPGNGDDRSEQWHWFTPKELEDPRYSLRPNVIFYAREALAQIG